MRRRQRERTEAPLTVVPADAAASTLDRRADALRERLEGEVGELGRRGREVFDVRLQLSRHPGRFALAGAAVVAGVLGRLLWERAQRRRPRGLLARLRRLWAETTA